MRITIAATVVCLLAIAPSLDHAACAAAQAAPRSVLARVPTSGANVPTTDSWKRPRTSLATRSNASMDFDGDGAHRIPLIAGVLGIVPGLGHLYAGEPVRGLIVAGVWFGSGLVAFSNSNTTVTGVGGVVLLGTSVFSVVDAVLAADRFNRRHARVALGGMQ